MFEHEFLLPKKTGQNKKRNGSSLKKSFSTALRLCGGIVFLFVSSPVSAGSFQLKLGKLFAEGRTVEMEEMIASRLKKEPDFLDLWLELADLRKSQGDFPGADRKSVV